MRKNRKVRRERTDYKLLETLEYPDRLSRALHRQARVAPPSMAQVTPLASRSKARARLGRPIPGRLRSGSMASFHTLSIHASRLSASAFAQAGSLFTPDNSKAKNRLTVACQIPPHPPQGGFVRPSNITRDYAQWACATLPRTSVGCTSPLSAAPHNQRYV